MRSPVSRVVLLGLGLAVALVVALVGGLPAQTDPVRRPNVLVVLLDDLGFSDLGCYGGEIETPHIDALAAGGLRFTDFYNTARCWTTRAALLTGYYPAQVNIEPRGVVPAWTRTLPERLAPSGYRSYHSGKWHVWAGYDTAPVARAKFDRSYWNNDYDRYFGPRMHYLDDGKLPAVAADADYYATTAMADRMIEFLAEHEAEHDERPFFAYLAFIAPHFPLHARPDDIAKYDGRYDAGWDAIRAQRYARVQKLGLTHGPLPPREEAILAPSGNAEQRARLGAGEVAHAVAWDDLSPEQRAFQANKMEVHAAMVDRVDQEVGRVVDWLRAHDELDDTLILVLSDNGASAEVMVRGDGHDPEAAPGSAGSFLCLGPGWSTAANTPMRRHKIWTHEGGISTPLVAHWPRGIAARGELRHAPSHVVDLTPTLMEVAGIAAPVEEGAPPLPGRSLVPAFAADVPIARPFVFFHHAGNRALRVGDHKLVSSKRDGDAWELYDLATDRGETRDLAEVEPERLAAMVATWEQEYARQLGQGRAGPPKIW